jgi:hypothetical protein
MPKDPVIALGPNVPPPGSFQFFDDLAHLLRHINQNSEGLGYDDHMSAGVFAAAQKGSYY